MSPAGPRRPVGAGPGAGEPDAGGPGGGKGEGPTRPRGFANRIPAPAFLVASGLVQYVGAAVAVGIFDRIAPASVGWWRFVVAGVFMLAWRRPWTRGLTWRQVGQSAVFGIVMGLMNITFYEAIARIPLGATVSLEFLGPVALAVVRGRGAGPRVAAVLALAGVVAIGGLGLDTGAPGVWAGVAFALVAGAAWVGYIVLGQRIAQRRSGVDSLAIGCATAALVYAPIFGRGGMVAFSDWMLIGAVLLVGVLSTVVPYSFEALAMSRVSAATFALLTALLPATSAITGAIMLRQIPNVWELVGIALISVAVWVASRPTAGSSAGGSAAGR